MEHDSIKKLFRCCLKYVQIIFLLIKVSIILNLKETDKKWRCYSGDNNLMTNEHTDGSKTCCVKYTKATKGTNSVSKGDNEVDMSNTYCHHHYSQYNIMFPVPKALWSIIKYIIFQINSHTKNNTYSILFTQIMELFHWYWMWNIIKHAKNISYHLCQELWIKLIFNLSKQRKKGTFVEACPKSGTLLVVVHVSVLCYM